MAHSKSAIKRWRQSLKRRDNNRSVRSHTRTMLTKALAAIQDDPDTAEEAVRHAVSALDKAAQKGIIHDNAAARGKSRLLKRYNLATASSVAAAAEAAPAAEQEEKPTTRRRRASSSKPATSRGRSTAKKDDDSKPAPRSRTRKT